MAPQADPATRLAALVSSASWDRLAEDSRPAVLALVTDALAVAAAGRASEVGRRAVAATPPGEVAVPWCTGAASAADAAFATSALMHATDYDDTHDVAVVHTACTAVAAALAVARAETTGSALLAAVVAGVEVAVRLGAAIGPNPHLIRSATCGVFAAAAAAARLEAYDEDRTASALAIALSASASTRQVVVDGSAMKRLQPALAARNGVMAARLAGEGVVGPPGWLTGEHGLLATHGTTGALERLQRWGDAARPAVQGLSLKPYPTCRYTHAPLHAAVRYATAHPTTPSPRRVTAHVPHAAGHDVVARPWARRGDPIVDAQFSTPWCVAAGLLRSRLRLTDLHDLIGDPAVEALAERVSVIEDLVAGANRFVPAELEVTGDDGPTTVVRVDVLPGSPELPMTAGELTAKVRNCIVAGGLPAATAERLTGIVSALPGTDLRALRSLVGAAADA